MKSIIYALFFVSASALAGTSTHGGDSIAQDFVAHGWKALENLKPQDFPGLKLEEFKSALENTFVSSSETALTVTEKGRKYRVDATNDPEEKTIIVNRHRWLKLSEQRKQALALHEYFGILRLELDRYSISARFVNKSRVAAKPQDATGKDCVFGSNYGYLKEEEGPRFAAAEIGDTLKINRTLDQLEDSPVLVMVVELSDKETKEIYQLNYTHEDRDDGGNTLGWVESLSTREVVAIIGDSDLYCTEAGYKIK